MRVIGLAVVLTVGLVLAPLAAEAQPAGKVYRIGALTEGPDSPVPTALKEALQRLGWIEGRNLTIETRNANTREQLPAFASELARLKVDLIFTIGTPATLAAKKATTTIPIVFTLADDPVASGLVVSFARPGGNLTGFAQGIYDEKLLEVLKEAVPKASRVAYFTSQGERRRSARLNAAAQVLGVEIQRVVVQGPNDFDNFFAAARGHSNGAVLVPDVAWF